MTEKDKIAAELKELDLTEEQFKAALERRLMLLGPQREVEDKPDDYCTACVL